MSATSVGQIGLDLVVNQKSYNKQMSGIQSLASKAGKALAAAFAVKKIVDFGKECTNLGSDLQEVQNVVDVTFPTMSKKVDEFAKGAAASFGLSETMAKKFTGTFGSMAKAFGFSEQQAYNMGASLTELAGDVASFYNLSQDEAYTKLKSVFTGETESLKDLGVVMTQTALDSYALANGFGKTTKAMSEAEKVALRYSFVQDQLSAAAGDFSRTSGGWANQVRVLNLQFDSLKATLGQGLINVFTPVIKVINTLIAKLAVLADSFKSFTEMVMGDSGGSAMNDMANAAASAAVSTSEVEKSADGAATSAKKAAKALMGFDKIQTLGSSDSTGKDTASASSGASIPFENINLSGAVEKQEKRTNAALESIKSKLVEVSNLFKEGFNIGSGGKLTSSLLKIKNHIIGIGSSLKGIIMDQNIVTSANSLINTLISSFGKLSGAFSNIWAAEIEFFAGSIDKYFSGNGDFLKEKIASIFDISGEITTTVSDLYVAFSSLFDVFKSDKAKSIGAGLIEIISNSSISISELALKLGRDISGNISKPLIKNKDKIKETLEGILVSIEPVVETLKTSLSDSFENIGTMYDEKIKPMFDEIGGGLSRLTSTFLDAFNEHIKPLLDKFSGEFSEIWKSKVQPIIDKATVVIGKIANLITVLWKKVIEPVVNWLIKTLAPIVASVIDGIWSAVKSLWNTLSGILSGLWDALGGIVDFLTGVFTGDWNKAWEGIKSTFTGIWDAISAALNGVIDFIGTTIGGALNNIKATFGSIWSSIKERLVKVVTSIRDKIVNTFTKIKERIKIIITSVKTTVGDIFEKIRTKITGVVEKIRTGVKDGLEKVKKNFKSIFTSVKTTVTDIFDKIWSKIKNVINSILGGIESMANGIVKGINKAIEAMNKLKFNIPNWVPEIGGKSFGFNIPTLKEIEIPKLAEGGYVKKNTPQLAVIGDNRHQGEITAPEDKMLEMAKQAAILAGGNRDAEIISLLKQILQLLSTLNLSAKIDVNALKQLIVRLINDHTKATGVCEIIT